MVFRITHISLFYDKAILDIEPFRLQLNKIIVDVGVQGGPPGAAHGRSNAVQIKQIVRIIILLKKGFS